MRLDYAVVTDLAELRRVAQKLHDAKILGFDVETAIPGRGPTLDPLLGKIRLVQLNIYGEIFVLDLWKLPSHDVLLEAMRSTKAVFIIHNAKYEQKWFWHHYGFEFWPVFDTMRASGMIYNGRVIEPLTVKGKTALDLDSCVERELGERPTNVGKGGSNWSGDLSRSQLDYAAEDVLRLPDLRDRLKAKLKKLSLFQPATIEFGVILPEAVCELNGFPVDRDAWLKVAEHHKVESRKLAEELLYELPHPKGLLTLPGMNGSWNLGSTVQLLESLKRLGCPVDSTQHSVLAMQAGRFPEVLKILKHREHTTRLKMFGPDWLGNLHPKTGRVHTSYYSLLAAGRYSSSDPNLQQIPRESVYRACFVAPPGKVFIVADYSGIEMRIVAELSGDERLIRVFSTGADAHYETASLLTDKPVSEVTKPERQMAKPVNFGFCLVAGTKVITSSGTQNIECIEEGTQVLTHKKRFQPVTATQKVVFSGHLVRITTRTGRVLESTPDHMWLVRFPGCNGGDGWVRADDLEVGRCLVYHGSTIPADGCFSLGEDRALVLGWFLSEGSFSTQNGLQISQCRLANPDVYAHMALVLRRLGWSERVERSGSISRFYCPASIRAEQFPNLTLDLTLKSAGKIIPPEVYKLSAQDRLAVLAGLWEGDGHVGRRDSNRASISYTSISRALLRGVQRLLDSVGINSTVYEYNNDKPGVLHVSGTESKLRFLRQVPAVKCRRIDYTPKKVFSAQERITKIERIPFEGYVYDITVQDDHSFAANGVFTHNCYGMGAAKLVVYAFSNYGVAMTEEQAVDFRKRYFSGYRGVRNWHGAILADREAGMKMSRTMSGRLRFLDPQKHYNEYFNCLDDQTEALTQRGWVLGPDLRVTDTLLTKNAATGHLVWQSPTDVKIWHGYNGPLVKFESRSFSAVSTPNHRWLVRDKYSGKDVCKRTDEISVHGDHRIHRTGNYEGAPERGWSDDFVEFVGWLVTDGSLFPLKRRNNTIRMTLTQSARANPEKVARIDRLVERLGWGHSRHVAAKTQQVIWTFQDFESAALHSEFPDRSLTMPFLMQLTSEQAVLLFEVMMLGDGTRGTKQTFTASSKNRADMFQILCTMTGYAARVAYQDTRHRVLKKYESMGNIPKTDGHYEVCVQKRKTVQVVKSQKTCFEAEDATIWCPIVPNTYFVARRKGQVFITGNTPVQGTGADALKLSLRNMHDIIVRSYGGRVKLVHHVHDEIILEVDNDPELIDQVKKDLERAMVAGMSPYLTRVPIEVDAHSGKTWADAK